MMGRFHDDKVDWGNGASSITPEGEDHKACFSEKMAHFDPTLPADASAWS